MTKVYANEEVAVIQDSELVGAIMQLSIIGLLDHDAFVEGSKVLSDALREELETDFVIGLVVLSAEHVAILTYNILADDENHFAQGQDEYGFYLEV